jgi:hypothetical protein
MSPFVERRRMSATNLGGSKNVASDPVRPLLGIESAR